MKYMKVLFLTTYNVPINKEHFFTKSVWQGLCAYFSGLASDRLLLATIFETHNSEPVKVLTEICDEKEYYQIFLPANLESHEKVGEISKFFGLISPTIIHSNMVETFDVQAAKSLNIPIVLTMHIGGLVCPRGGGSGFLKYDDSICNQSVSNQCLRCCSEELPFPSISYLLEKIVHRDVKCLLSKVLCNRQILYLTPFLQKSFSVENRVEAIRILKYATIIAANQKLVSLLALNGLQDNVKLIPHGVNPRKKLKFPRVDGAVKFYFLGRIQYSKGLHNVLLAFRDIPTNLYELHIIGDAENQGPSRRYDQYIRKIAKKINVYFHGRVPNDQLDDIISELHVMIHPAIFHEIYGIAIAESLSMGRPVLATKCGGAEMQVIDGVNGWLVNQNDVPALQKKILQIIEKKSLLPAISENCHLPHPLSEYTKNIYSLYKELSDEQ